MRLNMRLNTWGADLSGARWARASAKNLFEPLRISHTTYPCDLLIARQTTKRSIAYHEASKAMDSPQASLKLNEQADTCLSCIRELANSAESAPWTRRTSSTTILLEKVKCEANDFLRLLQTWKKDFGKGEITNNQQLIDTTNGYFDNLRHWIDVARDALDLRLFFRKSYLIGFFTSKRLAYRPFLYET